MEEHLEGKFIEAKPLSAALSMAAQIILNLGVGRSGRDSEDVLAYIRECNADPKRRQEMQQFLILCSCGVVSMAQQIMDAEPAIADGKAEMPIAMAGKMFAQVIPTPTSKKQHRYIIKTGDEMVPFTNTTEMSLDIACRDLAKLCDHVEGPLKMGTWIKQMEAIEAAHGEWTHMDRKQFRSYVKVMLAAIGSIANLTQEVSTVVMKDTFGRLLTME